VIARKDADTGTHQEIVAQDDLRVFASPNATQVIDVGIFTHVNILRISYRRRCVDPGIPLGMDVGSPGYMLVDVVSEAVKQRDQKAQ
jgi:hypothetical protein